MVTITSGDARNALAVLHGFTSLKIGIDGTLAIFDEHQCVQSDPIEVAGANADLTLQSRVSDYRQGYLYHLLYEKRLLFEYYCKMLSILPVEMYPFFERTRNIQRKKHQPFFNEHQKETELILKMLEDGCVCSRDFKGWKKVEWWGSTALSRVILERLMACGKVLIHHREGGTKFYALAEECIPREIFDREPPDDEECIRKIVKIIVRASRLVSPSGAPEQWYSVGKTQKMRELLKNLEKEGDLFSMTLENYRGIVYAPHEDEGVWEDPPHAEEDYVRFLAPLDPLNWNRRLFKAVYEREYSWEVYKKAKDRKYGYYCLPILFNGDYVGLIEPFYDKKKKTLEIRTFHMLAPVNQRKFRNALENELVRFAQNLEAESLNGCHPWLKEIAL
ncbi:MAG: YcaQ family DNA glycosylase [Theionarchaea archaeon]|nr:YcaQ family DNA glycosylase [Theionarchaea archaeon]